MKINLTMLLAPFLCIYAVAASAQEKKISATEVKALRDSATEKLKQKSYRVKSTSQSYKNVDDPAPYWFITSVTETASNAYRIITERKTVDGTTREETIRVGDQIFVKAGNGAWQRESPNGGGSGVLRSSPVDNEKKIECRYLGKENINGKTADLYEIKTIYKYKLSSIEWQSIYTERFWFDQSGWFLKTETASENKNKITSHMVSEYEYDPNIKIEAPIK